MTIARDVIKIGRGRTRQQVTIASRTLSPSISNWCANSTIRMLFNITTPANISTPINDITLQVVPVSTNASNVLHNAVKYSPVGGAISVSVTSLTSSVILKIADSGPGISAEHRARIFQRFYRIDTGRTRDTAARALAYLLLNGLFMRKEERFG
jgi:signal transduction histidine kinase